MWILLLLHVMFAVIWVGGMFFAHQILRPVAVELLEPPLRLQQWRKVLGKFFIWVWKSIIIIPVTGYWLVFGQFNSFDGVGMHVKIMHLGAYVMIAVFLYVFFLPFKNLKQDVDAGNFPQAADHLVKIRRAVGINLVIGLLLIAVAAGGRLYAPLW